LDGIGGKGFGGGWREFEDIPGIAGERWSFRPFSYKMLMLDLRGYSPINGRDSFGTVGNRNGGG